MLKIRQLSWFGAAICLNFRVGSVSGDHDKCLSGRPLVSAPSGTMVAAWHSKSTTASSRFKIDTLVALGHVKFSSIYNDNE